MAGEFVFRHAWEVAAPVDRVYDVLVDVEHYPDWWPQVLAVAHIDDVSGRVVCRSLAPFELDLVLTSQVQDPDRGVLRVAVSGDLEGWCAFGLVETDAGSRLEFEQRVRVARRGLRTVSRWLGPVLRLNHAWMMRGCRIGLERHLATTR